jgi:hypothetical protein
MIGLEVEGQKKTTALLRALGKNADEAISVALLRCAQHAEGEIKRTAQRVFKPGTGNLMRSFKAVMLAKEGDILSAGAVSDLVYAGIQNDGGEIVSSRGPSKYLAYPVVELPVGQWARDTPGLHVGIAPPPSKLGLVLMDASNKVIFNLAKKVTITGKKYIESAQEDSSKEWPRIFNERLAELADESARKADK